MKELLNKSLTLALFGVAVLLVILLSVIIALCWPSPSSQSVAAESHRCILVIGGFAIGLVDSQLVEYYHPTSGECDQNAIGRMSTQRINTTHFTSSCYLANTQQALIRDTRYPDKPPVVYGLRDSSAAELPLPYRNSVGSLLYTRGSTSASISPSKCLSCGGRNRTGDALRECYQFDSSSSTNWTAITSLPKRLFLASSVYLGGNIDSYFVTGGEDEYVGWSKHVYRYSVREGRWYEEASLYQSRFDHSSAALSDSQFIVCGGEYRRRDCEVYDATQKKWHTVGNLNTGRQNFAMVAFNGRVYALAGEGPDGLVNSVEVYDGRTEKWTLVKALKNQRYAFVAVVV